MTQTRQIPMLPCDDHWERMIGDCKNCNGTGEVIDLDTVKKDIAGAEKSCTLCRHGVVYQTDGSQVDPEIIDQDFCNACKGSGKVPMFEGLRKPCDWKRHIHPQINHPDCGGKGYTSGFTLEELLESLDYYYIAKLSDKEGVEVGVDVMDGVPRQTYDHPKVMTAACVATWLALEAME